MKPDCGDCFASLCIGNNEPSSLTKCVEGIMQYRLVIRISAYFPQGRRMLSQNKFPVGCFDVLNLYEFC